MSAIAGLVVGAILFLAGIQGLMLFFRGRSRHIGFLGIVCLNILWGFLIIIAAISKYEIIRWASWIVGWITLTLLSVSYLLKYPVFYEKKRGGKFIALGIFGLLIVIFLTILFCLVYTISKQA